MCARYQTLITSQDLREAFEVEADHDLALPEVRPTDLAPVIVRDPATGKRELREMRWGLVPAWAKDPKIGRTMFNARAEGIAEKPSFREAFKRRRCLVPMSAFYEWCGEKTAREKHEIASPGRRPFAIAGLWEVWRGEAEPMHTFTVITTDANERIAPIHDRMPAVLSPQDYDLWLSDQPGSTQLAALLIPGPFELVPARIA